MNISFNNNVNFKGAFLINCKNMTPEVKTELQDCVDNLKKKNIIENFNNKEGLNLYVTKNCYDVILADFICSHKLKFKYMPDITTKERFDSREPEQAVEYIKTNKPTCITKINELSEFIEEYRIPKKKSPAFVKSPENFLRCLDFNINGIPTTDNKGITKIIDKANGKSIYISPQNRKGVTYIRTQDREGSYRYAITNSGDVIELPNDVDGILAFRKKFNGAVEHYCKIKISHK